MHSFRDSSHDRHSLAGLIQDWAAVMSGRPDPLQLHPTYVRVFVLRPLVLVTRFSSASKNVSDVGAKPPRANDSRVG